jgi:cytochrome oxidase Cu insertion factor (SCO1/SenC/PrrC family)
MLDPFPPPASRLSPADDPAELLPTVTTPNPGRVRRAMLRGLLLGLLIGAATGAVSFASQYLRAPQPLPVLGLVPSFSLLDQGGQPFDNARLAGAPWIAGFVFTSCTDTCPMITARMASLQRELAGTPVRLATFSVDPAHDTPAVLADYGRRAGADFARWSFATGAVEGVQTLVTRGFKLTMLAGDPKVGEGQVLHDERLVLVDGRGRIRGYYDGDTAAVARLGRDARRLAESSGG